MTFCRIPKYPRGGPKVGQARAILGSCCAPPPCLRHKTPPISSSQTWQQLMLQAAKVLGIQNLANTVTVGCHLYLCLPKPSKNLTKAAILHQTAHLRHEWWDNAESYLMPTNRHVHTFLIQPGEWCNILCCGKSMKYLAHFLNVFRQQKESTIFAKKTAIFSISWEGVRCMVQLLQITSNYFELNETCTPKKTERIPIATKLQNNYLWWQKICIGSIWKDLIWKEDKLRK